jgi:site-specific DNA-cytosine methylase
MKVLIACEESQTVCIAFRELGHQAYSCDIQNCSGGHPEWHIKDDVLNVINDNWELMIAHPPCTYFSRAAGRVLYDKNRLQFTYKFFEFVLQLYNSNIKKIAIENPPGWLCTNWRKPDQKIHPYYFGNQEMKETCLWLKNLPLLNYYLYDNLFSNKTSTDKPIPLSSKIGSDGKIKNKYFVTRVSNPKLRSKTFPGIAKAMATQWGRL